MQNSRTPRFAGLLALGLSACSPDGAAEAGNRLRALSTAADPAVTSAIDDAIMTDEGLASQDMSRAIRATPGPVEVTYPAPDAVPKQGQGEEPRRVEACAKLEPGLGWAKRLPPEFRPVPGVRLIEAAGKDAAGCHMRYIAFHTEATPPAVLEHYRSRAAAAGYSSIAQLRAGDHVLSGAAPPGRRFHLIVTAKGGGSEAALLTSAGPGSTP